jgi:hypothetical protein
MVQRRRSVCICIVLCLVCLICVHTGIQHAFGEEIDPIAQCLGTIHVRRNYNELGRFDASGGVWEFGFSKKAYPEIFNVNDQTYRVFSRAK